MKLNSDLTTRLTTSFRTLTRATLPVAGTLTTRLNAILQNPPEPCEVDVKPEIAGLFCSASVDMWMRGVHSFLISASLTTSSPIWSSVAGYYSSHYSIRAIAHLLGHFQLFQAKLNAQLTLQGGKHICEFKKKKSGDREHHFYWRIVKNDPHFKTNPVFVLNTPNTEICDVSHRDKANYWDHVGNISSFTPLDATELKNRIRKISQISFDAPQIPDRRKFPDLENVQIVAYHRLVKYRDMLDEVLGDSNNFWSVFRKPSWAWDYLKFQLVESSTLSAFAEH